MFGYLQFAPDQKALIAEKWRRWVQRRVMLDAQLATALLKLDSVCPSSSGFPPEVLQLVEDAAAGVL